MSELLPHHLQDVQRSGLSDMTIRELGFYSGSAAEVRGILGFDAGPGLVIPYPIYDTPRPFSRVKPDSPPLIDGKPPKYLSPKGSLLQPYIPPRSWEALKNPMTRLLITEGEKKAAKADQEGFPCLGLGGIYGFRDREHLFLPALEKVVWAGRDVVLVPDSDVGTNQNVRDAVWELG
jgi:hypothetical protein